MTYKEDEVVECWCKLEIIEKAEEEEWRRAGQRPGRECLD